MESRFDLIKTKMFVINKRELHEVTGQGVIPDDSPRVL